MENERKKLLLVERFLDGHRGVYLQTLTQGIKNYDIYLYAPHNIGVQDDRFIGYRKWKRDDKAESNSMFSYFQWMHRIRHFVKQNKIDCLHFTDGDLFMKYCGLGLPKKCKVVITMHHFINSTMKRAGYKFLGMMDNVQVVVHSEKLKERFSKLIPEIKITVCYYPGFNYENLKKMNVAECKTILGLNSNRPVIGIIGGARKEKNIERFLYALQRIGSDYTLLFCGNINRDCMNIKDMVVGFDKNKCKYIFGTLTDDDYFRAIAASDIIFNIYGKNFDGASGPMIDGVCCEKLIISCDHGTLGDTVKRFHLGYSADAESDKEIKEITERAIKNCGSFHYDEKAKEFRDKIRVDQFLKRYNEIYDKICDEKGE